MKRNICFVTAVLSCLFTLSAQNIDQIYVNMPQALNPYLDKQDRFEQVEYAKAGQQDTVTNLLGGKSYLVSYDPEQQLIVMSHTANSLSAYKKISLNDSTYIIGVIETVKAPIASSTVMFYDAQWNLFPYRKPVFESKDFLDISLHNDEKAQRELMPVFVSATFSTIAEAIEYQNNTVEMLSADEQKKYNGKMHAQSVYFKQLFDKK